MAKYSQAGRMLAVSTPLGTDVLLLQKLSGDETISKLFRFELELLADSSTSIAFDQILGQGITAAVTMPDGSPRFFNGIVSRFSQGHRVPSAQGRGTLTRFRAVMVPTVWVLTRRLQSRIFQQVSIPDILKKVLAGFSVSYRLTGTYQPRDFCVQYRESDFNFASRLMEEEGIYYYFTHADGSHEMVVSDNPQGHADVPGPTTAIFEELEGGTRAEDRVHGWEKSQELGSGKYRLWDSCFELPGKNLEAVQPVLDSVPVGTVSHKLKVAGNDALEIYDYPGGYAQRFDGVAPGGGDRAGDLQKIFDDNKRTVTIRMQQEAAQAVRVVGASTCRQFVAGCKFTLDRHFDANGSYVLTHVEHWASVGDAYTTGTDVEEPYTNQFECIPADLPFRPARDTPRPTVEGTQTAVVVGALPVEQIFTDKYGRVKVQFFWDREGQFNADSSCWIRVATAWAGKGWGQINIPRIGHEVIVDFLEGDPDQPIIVGSVYNAENMPAKKLPDGKKTCGLVTRTNDPSVPGYNMITCDDSDGKEMVKIHGQYDMSTTIEHDNTNQVNNDESTTVVGNRTEHVGKKETITIDTGREETVSAGEKITISGGRTEQVDGGEKITIKGGRTESVTGDESITIDGAQTIHVTGSRTESVDSGEKVTITGNAQHDVSGDLTLHATGALNGLGDGKVIIQGPTITVQAGGECNIIGGSKLTLAGPGGTIVIDGGGITIQGTVVNIN
jgi:type VI secretion system secreted protein VgrG